MPLLDVESGVVIVFVENVRYYSVSGLQLLFVDDLDRSEQSVVVEVIKPLQLLVKDHSAFLLWLVRPPCSVLVMHKKDSICRFWT